MFREQLFPEGAQESPNEARDIRSNPDLTESELKVLIDPIKAAELYHRKYGVKFLLGYDRDQIALVERNDGRRAYLDVLGRFVADGMKKARGFYKGRALVSEDGEHFHYIDTSGRRLGTESFDDMWEFSDGIARAKRESKYYFIDEAGNNLTPQGFDGADDFYLGQAKVWVGGKSRVIRSDEILRQP